MKVVYVMEKPKSCEECDLCHDTRCEPLDMLIMDREEDDVTYIIEPYLKECPLRPLPEKVPCNYYDFEHFDTGHDRGWNDFYDKIMGE